MARISEKQRSRKIRVILKSVVKTPSPARIGRRWKEACRSRAGGCRSPSGMRKTDTPEASIFLERWATAKTLPRVNSRCGPVGALGDNASMRGHPPHGGGAPWLQPVGAARERLPIALGDRDPPKALAGSLGAKSPALLVKRSAEAWAESKAESARRRWHCGADLHYPSSSSAPLHSDAPLFCWPYVGVPPWLFAQSASPSLAFWKCGSPLPLSRIDSQSARGQAHSKTLSRRALLLSRRQ